MRSVFIPAAVTCVRMTAPLLPLLLCIPGNSQTWKAPGRPDLGRLHTVDLEPRANQKRVDDFPTLKNLRGNNLSALAGGEHQFLGITFQVGDGLLHLGSTLLKDLPEKTSF